MLRVGLTGGIASGKSTVAWLLAAHGAQVLDADAVVRDLMQPGAPVYHEVVKHFGRDIVNQDGTINRKALANLVFPSGRVRELNAIVHPAVVRHQDDWMAEIEGGDPQAIAVVEAALILEAGAKGHFDKMIVVTCPIEKRVQRYAERFGISAKDARAEVERRSRAQMPDQEKVKFADYVIDNSGTLAGLEKKVEEVFAELDAQRGKTRLRSAQDSVR
jgi:dephospho-CoA kinase